MGISAAFEIGKSGLKLFQVAAEVTSENIANVNTPGYSRQRVLFETAPPTTHNGFPLGTGVRVQVVERYYDSLLQKQLVNAGTTSGYDSHKLGVLQQVEPVFNEIAQDGLGAAMNDFFSAWQDLSINPSGTAERQSVLAKAQIMVDQFHYVSRSITDAITIQNESL
ncbi:MAG: flagellar basal body protein, partial [Geobacter sp.]